MSDDRFTQAELEDLFGTSLPMEVLKLLWEGPETMTLSEVRAKVRKMAAAHQARMSRVTPFIKETDEGFQVGAVYKSDGSRGPVADVYLEKIGKDDELPTWVTVCTDSYEGHASIHVEALPHLIKALHALEKKYEGMQAGERG